MYSPPRSILVLHRDSDLAASLRAASDDPALVWPVGDWDALARALRTAPPTSVAFVDPFLDGADAPAPQLQTLLSDLRSALVVAAFPVSMRTVPHLDPLVRWGVAEVIDVGREDTPAALRRRVQVVQARVVVRLLERAVPKSTPTRTRGLLTTAAETVARGGGSAELAAAMGTTERTVLRWCRRADLPHPRRLLAWLRVLLAADMLDDPGRTLAAVAAASGYSGESALRNALRTFLGAGSGELRGNAFATASSVFTRELFALREAAAARGRPDKTWLH